MLSLSRLEKKTIYIYIKKPIKPKLGSKEVKGAKCLIPGLY